MVNPRRGIVALGLGALAGCAALQSIGVVPLRFSEPADRVAEIRLLGPSFERPLGGAAIRLWARVENPNSFGLNLNRVAGDLHIEDTEAIRTDFPLGLPLTARQDTIIPLDVSLRFDDLPRLASLVRRALSGNALRYRLEGSFTVEAGVLGSPSFGPLTLLTGTLRVQ